MDREYEQQIAFTNLSDSQLTKKQEAVRQLNDAYYQNMENLKYRLSILEHLKNNCPAHLVTPIHIPTPSELFEGTHSHAQAIFDTYPQEYLEFAQSVVAQQMYYDQMNCTQETYDYWNYFYNHETKTSCNELCDQIKQVTLETNNTDQEIILSLQDQHHKNIQNSATTKTNEIIPETILVSSKKEKAKKAPDVAPQKNQSISTKQQAALRAAEKKAEQSRIDKERHRLALEQKKTEEATKLTASIPVAAAVTQSNNSKATKKKSTGKTNKKSSQPIDDDFDAILNDAIAENQKLLLDKKSSDETDEELSDLNPINQIIAKINETLAQQEKSNSIVAFNIMDAIHEKLESPAIQEYQEFLKERKRRLQNLEKEKEVTRKEHVKKILRARPHERQALKDKLGKELTTKFDSIVQEESDILMRLTTYNNTLSIKNPPLEKFISAYNLLTTKEQDLSQSNLHLKWYLALHQDLYNAIKTQVIQTKTRLINQILSKEDLHLNARKNITPEKLDEIQEKLDTCPENNNEPFIITILNNLHTDNGILDISNILHDYKTKEEINKLGRLTPYDLDTTIDERHLKPTTDLIEHLFVLAGIHSNHHYMIDAMIQGAKDMSASECGDAMAYNYISKFFNILQCKNEMNLEPLSIDEIADISKINTLLFTIFRDIAQSEKDNCKK